MSDAIARRSGAWKALAGLARPIAAIVQGTTNNIFFIAKLITELPLFLFGTNDPATSL
jgi:hypothetical protein